MNKKDNIKIFLEEFLSNRKETDLSRIGVGDCGSIGGWTISAEDTPKEAEKSDIL